MRACLSCHSTGFVRAKAGKKALFLHRQRCQQDANCSGSSSFPRPYRLAQCPNCSGLGVAISQEDSPQISPSFKGRICVVGGGIGGLAFALAGHHRGLDVMVFEKDEDFFTRSQGYALTMQQGFTQLRKLGFSMDKLRDIGTVSSGHITLDKKGNVIGRIGQVRWGNCEKKNSKRFNIQLPRQKLRQELLAALPEGVVNWGKKFSHASEADKVAYFSDGSSYSYDLLVGADGIWSQFVSKYPLNYLGVIVILGRGRISKINEMNLGIDKIWQTVDGVTRMYAMPFGIEGETMWQLSWQCSEDYAKSMNGQKSALLAEAKRRVSGWHDPWNELLESTAMDDVTGYPAYDRWPIPSFDDLMDNLVVLGDAAHPLSPFKGQGANQALADGVDLAVTLYAGSNDNHLANESGIVNFSPLGRNQNDNQDDINLGKSHSDGYTQSLIRRFHEKMLDRVSVKVEASREATFVLHSENALVKGDHTRGKIHN